MKWRGTLGLIFVFIILVALYLFLDWRKEEEKIIQEEVKKIFSFEPQAVRELSIQQAGKSECLAKKDVDGKWNFEKPSKDIPAFQYMWERIAKNLSELKNQRTLVEKVEDKSSYGLDKPSLILKAVVDGMKKPIELKFGLLDPTNAYRYATMDEQSVFLVDDKQFFELNRSLEDLRFRFLVEEREVPLVRIEFARIWTEDDEMEDANYTPKIGEESTVVIMERKDEKSQWEILSPSKGLADQEAVNALASEIQYGMGRDFIDNPESLSDYGLDPPRCRLTYYDAKNRKPQTLFLGGMQTAGQSTQEKDREKRKRLKLSECTGVFAKLAGQNSVFLLDPQFLQLLPRSPESFRNRKIFVNELKNVVKVERIEESQPVFILEKTADKGWVMSYPSVDDVDVVKINDYLGRLKNLEVQSFPGGTWEERGLNIAKEILKFTMEDGKSLEIRYTPIPDDALHSYISTDTGEIGIVTNDIVSVIWVRPESFRSLLLYRFSPSDVQEVEIEMDSTRYVFLQVDGQWTVKQPENKVLTSQGDILRLVRYMSTLTASDVSNQKEDEGKVSDVIMKVTIKPVENKQNLLAGTLIIGAIDENDARYRWAKKEGKQGVYLVKQELVDIAKDMLKSVSDVANPQ